MLELEKEDNGDSSRQDYCGATVDYLWAKCCHSTRLLVKPAVHKLVTRHHPAATAVEGRRVPGKQCD